MSLKSVTRPGTCTHADGPDDADQGDHTGCDVVLSMDTADSPDVVRSLLTAALGTWSTLSREHLTFPADPREPTTCVAESHHSDWFKGHCESTNQHGPDVNCC